MPHEHEEDQETNKKIESVTIEILDDGSFSYQVRTQPENKKDNPAPFGETHSYSYQDVDELLDDLKDDLTSPHFKKRKKARLGTGERFAALSEELRGRRVGKTERGRKLAKALPGTTEPVRNPAALAAYIGRKKFGSKRFAELAAVGRRRA